MCRSKVLIRNHVPSGDVRVLASSPSPPRLPESQTLIVWSTPHETILEPSGENFTSLIDSPYFAACAFCFSALRSSVAA